MGSGIGKSINKMLLLTVFALATIATAGFQSTQQVADFSVIEAFAADCRKDGDEFYSAHHGSDRHVICLKGTILPRTNKEVAVDIDMFGGNQIRPLLIVTSRGGDAESAISIAEALGEYDIAVDGSCYSACANYLFLAARNKYLLQGAEVGWHGGLIRDRESFDKYWTDVAEVLINMRIKDDELRKAKEDHWNSIKGIVERENKLLRSPPARSADIQYMLPHASGCAKFDWGRTKPKVVLSWRPGLSDFHEHFDVANVWARNPNDYKNPAIRGYDATDTEVDWEVERECMYGR